MGGVEAEWRDAQVEDAGHDQSGACEKNHRESHFHTCQRSGDAIIFDPLDDPDFYRAAAKQEGARISMVTETHLHADFVSGAAALASAAGAELLLSGAGPGTAGYRRSAFPGARWLADGDYCQR